MKIILAPDSFKDCLSGIDVCTILAEAARRELGDVEIRSFPMGDGGEGTLEAVLAATGGRRETLLVRDPLGRPVEAAYALLPNGEAFVEMAQASGLERLSRDERNPLLTSTYGTGQLISAALDKGCRKITVGIGGSATTDGGAGMAVALGARLVTADGRELVAMISLALDEEPQIRLRKASCPKSVEKLLPDGRWATVSFAHENGVLIVDEPLTCCKPVALRVVVSD